MSPSSTAPMWRPWRRRPPAADAAVTRTRAPCSACARPIACRSCSRIAQARSLAPRMAAGADLAAGVLEATVRAMHVPPREIVAWLAPAIGPRKLKWAATSSMRSARRIPPRPRFSRRIATAQGSRRIAKKNGSRICIDSHGTDWDARGSPRSRAEAIAPLTEAGRFSYREGQGCWTHGDADLAHARQVTSIMPLCSAKSAVTLLLCHRFFPIFPIFPFSGAMTSGHFHPPGRRRRRRACRRWPPPGTLALHSDGFRGWSRSRSARCSARCSSNCCRMRWKKEARIA